MKNHPFDKIELLSFVNGDCNDIKKMSIQNHVAECKICRDFLDQIAHEKSAFLEAYPFDASQVPVKNNALNRFFFVKKQFYSIAASLLLFLTVGYFFANNNNSNSVRIKGDVGIKVFVLNKNGDIEKRKEPLYFTGEKIQFVYSCGQLNRFVLFGIDSLGIITTYYPSNADSSMIIEKGQDIPLPNSIILDEYTGKEVFFAVFSQNAQCVSDLKKQLGYSYSVHKNLDVLRFVQDDVTITRYDCAIRARDQRK